MCDTMREYANDAIYGIILVGGSEPALIGHPGLVSETRRARGNADGNAGPSLTTNPRCVLASRLTPRGSVCTHAMALARTVAGALPWPWPL